MRALLLTGLLSGSLLAQHEFEQLVAVQLERVLDPDLDESETRACAEEFARLGPSAGVPLVERWLAWLQSSYASETHSVDPAFVLPRVMHVLREMGPGAEAALLRLVDEARLLRASTYYPALQILAELAPWDDGVREEIVRWRRELADTVVPIMKVAEVLPMPPFDEDRPLSTREIAFAWRRLRSRLSVDPRADVSTLIEALEDEDHHVVEFAAQILGARGPDAVPAIDALHRLVRDDSRIPSEDHARVAGVAALIAVAPEDPRTVPAYVQRLYDRDSTTEEVMQAVRALRRLGPEAVEAVTALRQYSWRDDEVMREVVRTLGSIGPGAAEALPMLEGLCESVTWDDELVTAARSAIEAIRGGR